MCDMLICRLIDDAYVCILVEYVVTSILILLLLRCLQELKCLLLVWFLAKREGV